MSSVTTVTIPNVELTLDQLVAAIDGQADAIVTGDSDLRADDKLRAQMERYGVALWGVERLLEDIRVR